MIVPKSARIDLNSPRKEVIHLTQDDNTRQAKVMLYADGRPYDVTADVSGATVQMAVAYILPNGFGDQYTQTEFGEPAVEQDANIKNLYTINIDGPCTDKVGFVDLLIKFTTEAGQVFHSFPLTLNVKRSRGSDVDPDGGDPSHSKYLRIDVQPDAAAGMTQPIGKTPDGQLVTYPTTQPDQAVIDAVVKSSFAQFNAYNLVGNIQGREIRGVHFDADGSTVHCYGTASPSAATCDIFNTTGSLPDKFEAGKSYSFSFSSDSALDSDNIKMVVTIRRSSSSTTTVYDANSTGTLDLPDDATGLWVYLNVALNDEVDTVCEVTFMSAKTNRELEEALDVQTVALSQANAAVQAVRQQSDNLRAYNAHNIIGAGTSGTTYGVTFSWSADAAGLPICGVSGTPTRAFYYALLSSPSVLPPGMAAGAKYRVTYTATINGTAAAPAVVVRQYKNGTEQQALAVNVAANTESEITLAADTNGIDVSFSFSNAMAVDASCFVTMLSSKTNAELTSETAALETRTTTVETRLVKTTGRTINLFDPDQITLGVNYQGVALAYRAISAAIPIGASGVYIGGSFPSSLEAKVWFYSSADDLSTNVGNLSNAFAGSFDVSTTSYPNKYLRMEINGKNNATITREMLAGIQLIVADGTEKQAFVPYISALDFVARNAAAKRFIQFTVCTQNVGKFRGGSTVNPWPADVELVYSRELNKIAADITAFQEVTTLLPSDENSVDTLIAPFFRRLIYVPTGVNDLERRVLASKTFPFWAAGTDKFSDGEPYCWADIDMGGIVVHVICVHLDPHWQDENSTLDRFVELGDLLAIMGNYEHVIALGDFNSGVNHSQDYQSEIDVFLNAGYICANCGRIGTLGENHIDNIICSPNILMDHVEIVLNAADSVSDHGAVGAQLTLII